MARRATDTEQKLQLRHVVQCSVRPGRLPFNPSARSEGPEPLLGADKAAWLRYDSDPTPRTMRGLGALRWRVTDAVAAVVLGQATSLILASPKPRARSGPRGLGVRGVWRSGFVAAARRLLWKGATSDQRRPCRMRALIWRAPPRCRRSLGSVVDA